MSEDSPNLGLVLFGHGWHIRVLGMLIDEGLATYHEEKAQLEIEQRNPEKSRERAVRRMRATPTTNFTQVVKDAAFINRVMSEVRESRAQDILGQRAALEKLRTLVEGKLYDEVAQILGDTAAAMRTELLDAPEDPDDLAWFRAAVIDEAALLDFLAKRFKEAQHFPELDEDQKE